MLVFILFIIVAIAAPFVSLLIAGWFFGLSKRPNQDKEQLFVLRLFACIFLAFPLFCALFVLWSYYVSPEPPPR